MHKTLNKIDNWVVEKEDERPARMDGTCFYCKEPIGGRHKDDCVIPQKRMKIRMEVVFDVTVPVCFTQENVEFRFNEGSWCKDNVLPVLEDLRKEAGCLCNTNMVFTVVEGTPGLTQDYWECACTSFTNVHTMSVARCATCGAIRPTKKENKNG